MMMPHHAPSVHHTDKLLPFNSAKETRIHKKCCSEDADAPKTYSQK